MFALADVAPATPGRWADLRLRVASAAVLVPLALACLSLGGPVWTALVAASAVVLGIEWVELCGATPAAWPGVLVPVSAAAAAVLAGADWPGTALALVVVASAAGLAGGRWIAGGVAYVGLPTVALSVLRLGDPGLFSIMFLLLVVWASDVGAYVAGRAVGGAKLAPAISPGKTWSGAAGGLATSVLLALVVDLVLAGGETLAAAVGLAAALAVASQVGDLFESWVKRRFGAKDSGRLIPGHGGALDRLDGLLAAASVMALVFCVAQRGVWWR